MDNICIDMDLYGLIGVEETASSKEIKKAYRKKALSCHPDKNPDNPKATELFHELSRALEILTDASARAAYDKIIIARRQTKERLREFDTKRKKFKEDLEAREQAYEKSSKSHLGQTTQTDEDKLRAEIERLRKEGSKQVEEEITRVRQEIFEELQRCREDKTDPPQSYRIKIKWKTTGVKNSGYDYERLHRIFSKYGDIVALAVSNVNKGKAIIEFEKRSDAEMAVNTEIGFMENPLTLRKMWDTQNPKGADAVNVKFSRSTNPMRKAAAERARPSGFDAQMHQEEIFDTEFESSVLRNLKEAEEKRRCCQRTNPKEHL